MSRYTMEDGTIVDTDRANRRWPERTYFNGSNQISRATGSQWEHETLYRSRKNRYYIERWSQWQGKESSAQWINDREAVAWLTANEYQTPDDLEDIEYDMSE